MAQHRASQNFTCNGPQACLGLVIWSLLAGILAAPNCWSQTDIHALEDALKGRQVELRSYSADSVARYALLDGKVVPESSLIRTIGPFTARSVKLKNHTIIIEGQRATLVRDAAKNKLWMAGATPMRIEVDLGSTDPASIMPTLQEMMFFSDVKAAIAGLPKDLAERLPFDLSGSVKSSCDCTRIFDDGHWIELNHPTANYIPPALLSSVEPKIPDEARDARRSGSVMLMFYVSETAEISRIWIANSVGAGLDQAAVSALRRYIFKPAQYNGRPVGTDLQVEVNFKIY